MAETIEKDDAPWWIRVAERFGLPTLILAVVTFFAREVAVALLPKATVLEKVLAPLIV